MTSTSSSDHSSALRSSEARPNIHFVRAKITLSFQIFHGFSCLIVLEVFQKYKTSSIFVVSAGGVNVIRLVTFDKYV